MKTNVMKFAGFILIPALLHTGGCSENNQAQAPETVYTNGFIYTVNPGVRKQKEKPTRRSAFRSSRLNAATG